MRRLVARSGRRDVRVCSDGHRLEIRVPDTKLISIPDAPHQAISELVSVIPAWQSFSLAEWCAWVFFFPRSICLKDKFTQKNVKSSHYVLTPVPMDGQVKPNSDATSSWITQEAAYSFSNVKEHEMAPYSSSGVKLQKPRDPELIFIYTLCALFTSCTLF